MIGTIVGEFEGANFGDSQKKQAASPSARPLRMPAYSIAALAGHLVRNGPSGWQTLALGLEDLFAAEQIWLEAKSS
jgi:hypothetical protein